MPDQQTEERTRKFPFPIIWMPPLNYKQGEAEKGDNGELNADVESVKEPVEIPSNFDGIKKPQAVHENCTGQVHSQQKEKSSSQRSIPVKQIEAPEESNSEHVETREKVASSKIAEVNGVSKAFRTSSKRKSSSPSKTSKSPPVCLRVDPLPKKRNGNTNSRSPSPPGSKGKSQEASKVSVSSDLKAKNHQDSQVHENASIGSKEGEAKKKNTGEVAEFMERKTCENKDKDQRSGSYDEDRRSGSQTSIPFSPSDDSREEILSSHTTKQIRIEDDKSSNEKDKGSTNVDGLSDMQASEGKEATKIHAGESEAKKKVLSDGEAALRIQSAYRGFEIRKWEPLKKLKQIAKVQEQVAEIRNKIHNLLQKDEKQSAIIEEMIMNILLKLDTIQGLHPSMRDVRKSLARELVTLQEKLDLLAQTRHSKDVSFDPVGAEERLSKDVGEHQHHDAQVVMDIVPDIQDKEAFNPSFKKSDNEGQRESPVTETVHSVENPELDNPEELQREAADMKPTGQIKDLESEKCGSSTLHTAVTEPTIVEHTSEVDLLKELTVEVIGDETTDEQEQADLLKEVPVGVIGDEATDEHEQMDLQKELPGGMIDDEETDEQKHDEKQEDEILHGADLAQKVSVNESEQQRADEVHVAIDTSPPELQGVEEPPHVDASLQDEKNLSQSGTEKQQLMEDCNEIFVGPHWVEVKGENEFCKGSTIPERDVEQTQTQTIEVNNYNKQMDGAQLDVTQQVSSVLENGSEERELNEVGQETVFEDTSSIPKATTTVFPSQLEKAPNGDDQNEVNQEIGEGIEEGRKYDKLESVDSSSIVVDQSDEAYGPGEYDIPMITKNDEEAKETLPVSAAADIRLSSELQEMEDNRKLVEENERMRAMVEKLIEAGKEQLDVINNLTCRVKDLEKKLSKRKKMGTVRFRRATTCATTSSNSLKKRAGNVVM